MHFSVVLRHKTIKWRAIDLPRIPIADPVLMRFTSGSEPRHISPLPAGTSASLPRFSGMRIREENCNMILLAVVTVFTSVIAGGATLLGSGNTDQFADRTTGRIE